MWIFHTKMSELITMTEWLKKTHLFQLTDFQVALNERDKIIQELTNSLKQSIEIRDQLNEQNAILANEAKKLREANESRRQLLWITDRREFDERQPRLSETTIDLVDDDLEDDEHYEKSTKVTETTAVEEKETKESDVVMRPNSTIEEFKNSLNEVEIALFNQVEERFEEMLNDRINDVKEKLQQEQLEKAELDSEANRLRQLLANIKSGSTEVVELRAELDKIHKKEMEKLRMYFERKCTDLEKQ